MSMLLWCLAASAQQIPPELLGETGFVSSVDFEQIHESPEGMWFLRPGTPEGKDCAVVFVSGALSLALIGPTGDLPGSIVFSGPQIPRIEGVRETQATLSADGHAAEVRAILTSQVVVPTHMNDTVRSLADSEKVELSLDGATVFTVQTAGSLVARDRLLACMKVEPVSGKKRKKNR